MSAFTAIRPYFRSNLVALGFKEWTDGFKVENIPSAKLEKAFHIESPTGSRRNSYDQQAQDVEIDVTIRTFRKGFKDPASAIDTTMSDLDTILTRCLASERRFGAQIKNITYNNHTISAINDTNDNAVLLEINFICFIILCV